MQLSRILLSNFLEASKALVAFKIIPFCPFSPTGKRLVIRFDGLLYDMWAR